MLKICLFFEKLIFMSDNIFLNSNFLDNKRLGFKNLEYRSLR